MTPRHWLLVLLVTGTALRLGLWLTYEPMLAPDTPSYMRTATNILNGDFSTHDGRRPPGYPLVLALGGASSSAVSVLQMLAGLVISLLLFSIAFTLTGRPAFAAAMGLTYHLNLAQLFFEPIIISETVSTLLVVSVVAALVHAHQASERSSPKRSLLLSAGVLAGAAVLTRPQFIALPVVAAVVVGAFSVTDKPLLRPALRRAALVALPGLLMIVAWCGFNYSRVGHFTVSTQTGIGLMNHSLAVIERAPDRYGTVRDIYVKHRDAKRARTGRHNANWDAIPELQAATGLSLPALSQELTSLSLYLFLHHPVDYAVGVVRAWIGFWLVPNYWDLERLSPSWLAYPLQLVWRIEQPALRFLNAIFLVGAVLLVASRRVRGRIGLDIALVSIGTIVFATSVVQAVAEYGENARYGVPLQALIVLSVGLGIRRWFEREPVASRVTVRGRIEETVQ